MFLLTNNTGYNIYRVFLRCENGLAKKKTKKKTQKEDRHEI